MKLVRQAWRYGLGTCWADLSGWLVAQRSFWRAFATLGLAAVAVLNVPGNPILDLNLRQHRLVGTLLSHATVLALALAFFGERRQLLDAVVRWPVRRWIIYFALALTAPLGVLWTIAIVWSAYARALLREQGLVEPVSFVLFIIAAWVASEHVRLLRSHGAEHRPYQLVMAGCLLFALEEVDWLGIFRLLLGARIAGVRVGSLHDLLQLAEHHPAVWVGLGVAAVALLVAVWQGRYLTGAFLRAEALDATSLPFYFALLALGLGQLTDVKDDVGGWFLRIVSFRVEEPLELVAALLLNGGLLLKYSRTRQPEG